MLQWIRFSHYLNVYLLYLFDKVVCNISEFCYFVFHNTPTYFLYYHTHAYHARSVQTRLPLGTR